MFRTPAESFAGLSGFFSILILLSGFLTIFYAFGNKEDIDSWGLFLAGGILDIVVGLILLNYPKITMVLFAVFVGFWLLFKGIGTISTAFKLKKEDGDNWGWVLFFGVLNCYFCLYVNCESTNRSFLFSLYTCFFTVIIGNCQYFYLAKIEKCKVKNW